MIIMTMMLLLTVLANCEPFVLVYVTVFAKKWYMKRPSERERTLVAFIVTVPFFSGSMSLPLLSVYVYEWHVSYAAVQQQ